MLLFVYSDYLFSVNHYNGEGIPNSTQGCDEDGLEHAGQQTTG